MFLYLTCRKKVSDWTIKCTELLVQNYFYEFNCKYKCDICEQIINNLSNVSITEYSCKIFFM